MRDRRADAGPGPPVSAPRPGEGDRRVQYSFAMLRVVQHPHTGAFKDVGVVLHSRPADFLGIRVISEVALLSKLAPDADIELLARYLESCRAIVAGDEDAGAIALLSKPERFYWLTAPRSDVIQASPVHVGVTLDPAAELDRLFDRCVRMKRSD